MVNSVVCSLECYPILHPESRVAASVVSSGWCHQRAPSAPLYAIPRPVQGECTWDSIWDSPGRCKRKQAAQTPGFLSRPWFAMIMGHTKHGLWNKQPFQQATVYHKVWMQPLLGVLSLGHWFGALCWTCNVNTVFTCKSNKKAGPFYRWKWI